MTQQLAVNRVQPRRGFFATVAKLTGRTPAPRRRETTTTAPYDPELHMIPPFALLNGGPR